MALVEFYQDSRKEWRWRVSDRNQILGASTEGYDRRGHAENNLRSLTKYARSVDIRTASALAEAENAEAKLPLKFYLDEGGKWRWRITASNGRIVHASSQGLSTKEEAVSDLKILVAAVSTWNG